MAKYLKAGCENPASSQRSEVIANRQTKPVAAMAGSFSRKIPGAKKAGQDVAGEANLVAITHGKSSPGKQTWKGASVGYTTREAPKYIPSPAATGGSESKGSAKQSVKGKRGKAAPGEAKSVAGVKSL
jgi:hypothetical protein